MTEYWTRKIIEATEGGWVPEPVVRFGIRRLCSARLSSERKRERQLGGSTTDQLAGMMSMGPVAVATEEANDQHYEQPTDLFRHTLGPRMKYSSCYWPDGVETLEQAEERALEETCAHAGIADGMDVLELGCGWGSLTLWIASRYPRTRITAVSNSATQRLHIETAARQQNLTNIRVVTADINRFDTDDRFDRVVSVEMFEHMNNYRELFRRVAGWTRSDGRVFVHVFAHHRYGYRYQTEGASNWMAQNFFTGGVMPSRDLLPAFQDDVRLIDQWWWSGEHYSRTAEAWLENMRSNEASILEVLGSVYGPGNARLWFQRWRMFYLACAELWGFRGGVEWGVGHYLFEPRGAALRMPVWSLAC